MQQTIQQQAVFVLFVQLVKNTQLLIFLSKGNRIICCSAYKSYSSKSKSSKSSDEYSAKDYVDADDFYYDHYDDFYDYEDAEDYYNEHAD